MRSSGTLLNPNSPSTHDVFRWNTTGQWKYFIRIGLSPMNQCEGDTGRLLIKHIITSVPVTVIEHHIVFAKKDSSVQEITLRSQVKSP